MDGLHVAFEGKVGQEPETRLLANGSEVLNLSVLLQDTKLGDQAEWIRVSCFTEKLDAHAREKLRKGAAVYVEGRARIGRWQGQDGSAKAGLNVNAWTVVPLGAIGRRPFEPDRPRRPAPDAAMPLAAAIPPVRSRHARTLLGLDDD